MKVVYICSPYRGDVENNIITAKRICRKASLDGYIVICPHLMYPAFLDDNNENERAIGLKSAMHLLNYADEVWALECRITDGMRAEINEAKAKGIPIRIVREDEF